MMIRTLACAFSVVLTGCTTVGGDSPECTGNLCGGVPETCNDVRYGDGTCDLRLDCAVPDIDCFRNFASDADAATWWSGAQTTIGQSFPTVPDTDPRFGRVRDALDRGWEAFKSLRPVGKLASWRPALVIVDKPLQNAAFVFGDRQANNQPFAVMVETAALTSGIDDNRLLGVMMHELQHAVALQRLGDIADRLRTFYVAPAGTEPLGRDQADDANVHRAGDAWRTAAAQVGPYAHAELGGLPITGIFWDMLASVANGALQSHPAECTAPVQRLAALKTAITGTRDPLDDSLTADLAPLPQQIADGFAALRDQCLPSFPYGVIEVGASLANLTPQQFEAALDPHDLALVKDKPFVDGLTAIVLDRRAAMRDAQAQFEAATGQPWAQLRYFSYEEDADDVSAMVMRGAHRDPASMGNFLRSLMPDAAGNACDAVVLSGLPGYGVDLTDEHHATCWRIGHALRVPSGAARTVPARPAAAIDVRIPGAIPTAPSLAGQIAC